MKHTRRRSMAIHRRRSARPGPAVKRRRSDRMLGQLILSALVLTAVVGVKLVQPAVLGEWRGWLDRLVGEDADFVAAFSAVGRAVGGQAPLGDALEDACVAVFGPQSSTPDAWPEDVVLFQEQLPFFTAAPVEGQRQDGFGWRQHPLEGGTRFHYGVDVAAPEGTEICAFADGRVSVVGESTALGRYVLLAHSGGYETLYAHCSAIAVADGQAVERGTAIARVGQTGQATGPHLHFELHRGKMYLNPVYYI